MKVYEMISKIMRALDGRKFHFEELKNIPIPDLGSISGWKQHPIDTYSPNFNEPLVPLGPFSDYPEIFHDSTYFGQHKDSSPYELMSLKGGLLTPFLRKSVADKVQAVSDALPDGYGLMVWDAYRTLEVQRSLFDYRVNKILTIEHPDWTKEQAELEAQKLVSIPSADPTKPSTHNTGGSVDLTIIQFTKEAAKEIKKLRAELTAERARTFDGDREYEIHMRMMDLMRTASKPLNMGVLFDENSPRTFMRYYEDRLTEVGIANMTAEETEAMQNRRIMAHLMTEAGFTIYEEEPWHFDFGNQFYSIKKGIPAVYSTAPYSDANARFEKMRVDHFIGTLKMQTGLSYPFAYSTGSKMQIPGEINSDFELAYTEARKASKIAGIEDHPMAQKL